VIEGLVLDFDGTILDTETSVLHAYGAVWQAFGVDVDVDFWSSRVGAAGDGYDWREHLAVSVGAGFDARLAETIWADAFRKSIRSVGPPTLRPGGPTKTWSDSVYAAS
jgi:beta-phosphoglucomutase-like phosphatase (HAD superfamily)